jgi:Tol biopolymer transport system component
MIGQTISHYKILEKLGEGGMGVVYKAHDTTLNREVAIKFLPPHISKAGTERERFLQEAQAVASLNHPNICVIHEINEDTEQPYIVLEYVDGSTIRTKLENGPFKVDDAIKYGIQIGEALQEAHSKGIIHRDIKADNIIINSKGQAKVMDFGLAKLKGSLKLTRTSSTVGTLGYMAPEQIQGGEVDSRSDIFAFAVLFFEMLAGRLPFRGEHEAAMIYSIVNEEPEPIEKFIPNINPEIIHTLGKALEKDPENRYQHIQDMVVDLRRSKKDSSRVGRLSTMNQQVSHQDIVAKKVEVLSTHKKMWLATCGLAVIIITGALYYFNFDKHNKQSLSPMKTVAFASYPGYAGAPAFSPEGNSIAFVWNGDHEDNYDIYVKLIDAGSPFRLTNDPAPEGDPVWSPDGRYIAFSRSVHGGISFYTIPSLGGHERKIADVASSKIILKSIGSSIDWSPDGKTLAVSATDSSGVPNCISLLSIETGRKLKLTSPNMNGQGDFGPKYSPNGNQIAFLKSLSSGVVELYTIPSNGGKEKRLTFDNLVVGSEAWTRDGQEIVFSSNRGGNTTLWRMPSEGGPLMPVTNSGEDVGKIDIGKNGDNLAYSRPMENINIWRLNLGMSLSDPKPSTKLISSRQKQMGPQYSPDGRSIAFVSDRSGSMEVWVCNSDGSNPIQFTFFRGPQVGSPRWSPDGRSLLLDSREKGNGNIYIMSSNGGTPRQLTSGKFENNIPSWSRDGRWIYFSSNRTGTFQIWKIPADGGQEIQVTKYGGFVAFESYDGKYLYYAEKNNNSDILRVPLIGGEEQLVDKHLSGLLWCMWKLTERGIYFIKPDTIQKGRIYFYSFSTQQTNQVAITEKPIYYYSGMEVSPDERFLLYTQVDRIESDIMLIQNFH